MDSSSSSFLSLSFSPLLLYLIHTSIFFSLLWCVSFSVPWFVHYPVILLLHFLNPSYVCFFFFFDCLSFIVSPFFFFRFCYPVHLHSPALAAVFDSSLTFFLSLKDLPLSLSTHHTTVFTLHLGDTYTQHPHIYFSLKSSSLFVEITQSPNNCSM